MGWIEEAKAKQQARLKRLQDSAPALHGQFGTDFHTAPGWREIGMFYSLIPDAIYPPDWKLVKAVQKLDPSLTWIWVKWVFLSPQETGAPRLVTFGRHGIARYVADPHGELYPMEVEGASWFKGPKPNIFEVLFQGERRKGKGSDLPGEYQPFNDQAFAWVKDHYGAPDPETMREGIRAKRAYWEKMENKKAEEFEYMMKDIDKYTQKQLDKISDVEMREHALGDVRKAIKPYAFLGK